MCSTGDKAQLWSVPHLNFPNVVYNSCVDLGFTEYHSPICFRSFAPHKKYVQPTQVLSWLRRNSTFSFKTGHLVWVGRVATLTHMHKGRTWLLLDHHSASVNSHEQKTWAEKHIFSWSLTSSLLSDSQWSHTNCFSNLSARVNTAPCSDILNTDGWWAAQSISTFISPQPWKVYRMPLQIVDECLATISWMSIKTAITQSADGLLQQDPRQEM